MLLTNSSIVLCINHHSNSNQIQLLVVLLMKEHQLRILVSCFWSHRSLWSTFEIPDSCLEWDNKKVLIGYFPALVCSHLVLPKSILPFSSGTVRELPPTFCAISVFVEISDLLRSSWKLGANIRSIGQTDSLDKSEAILQLCLRKMVKSTSEEQDESAENIQEQEYQYLSYYPIRYMNLGSQTSSWIWFEFEWWLIHKTIDELVRSMWNSKISFN